MCCDVLDKNDVHITLEPFNREVLPAPLRRFLRCSVISFLSRNLFRDLRSQEVRGTFEERTNDRSTLGVIFQECQEKRKRSVKETRKNGFGDRL
ncbi:hypothetical protein HZH68_001599 [Vespula germanica]|uniref:Uncharacterized protein n=1 Tax=Vespula germanica TaxID=30212 RepID=A0A834NVS5_VESGE|nr:hypothetical protein HZH68_001599 [Vespula germanica]